MKKSIVFTILTWAALIMSIRLMLFFLPVMIDRMVNGRFSMDYSADITTLCAIVFAVVVLAITGRSLFVKKS